MGLPYVTAVAVAAAGAHRDDCPSAMLDEPTPAFADAVKPLAHTLTGHTHDVLPHSHPHMVTFFFFWPWIRQFGF